MTLYMKKYRRCFLFRSEIFELTFVCGRLPISLSSAERDGIRVFRGD